MKTQIFIALVAFFVIASGVFVPPRQPRKQHLLGAKECTWGPSYWCKNLTAAAGCHATKHCIQTVWIHKQLPPDHSSVCQTCLDMVKQARDQLESNETQELIKEVFEGSCKLLHFKEVVKECDKIADEYIPDLIDTLASQMNPQVVCSVAGLCNNEKFQKLDKRDDVPENTQLTGDTCEGCHTVVGIMETKLNKMSRDDVLQAMLQLCRKTSSLADACSNIVVTYFTEIYDHLKANFNTNDVCLLAGECSAQFHTHANVEITPISHIGYVSVQNQKDDLPCELCEQLVGHLRDLLVANTTESEFKKVLEGLCKQTKSFTTECLSLVDEYYAVAYNFLVSELDPNAVCVMGGICPGNHSLEKAPIIPLLPVQTVETLQITPAPPVKNQGKILINMAKDDSFVKVMVSPEEAQLPIERLMPPHAVMYNTQKCVFCEYFLHYLQQAITNPKSEEEIKDVIDKACSKLPSSINKNCMEFVDMYEPALIAILAEEIDPSQVCPLIKACPSSDVGDVEIFMTQGSDGGKCPLCLFAVDRLEQMVKNGKTEENIKAALNKLCSHLSDSLAEECNDFVNTYTNELVEMLIADLTPQEVCVYLKLCTDNRPPKGHMEPAMFEGDIETNMIPDDTVEGVPVHQSEDLATGPNCVLCEFIMKQIQDELKDNSTEEEIKKTVHHICNVMPGSIRTECNGFVNQYADMVIQLLIAATVPSEICRMMHMCPNAHIEQMKVEVLDCAICEAVVYGMEKILDNPRVDHSIEHVLEKACRALPAKDQAKCQEVIEKYGKTIYDLVIHLADKGLVCREIGMCAAEAARPKRQLVGANPCTRGPGHWCSSLKNAQDCGSGAVKHCEDKVWNVKGKPAE